MQPFNKIDTDGKAKMIAAMSADAVKSIIAATKAAGDADTGTFDVIVSTEDVDRHGEVILASGWDLANYKANPVVLWAHDYSSLPIGICTEVAVEGDKLHAKGKFVTTEFAQQVRALYDQGAISATSVGLIAEEMQGNTITKAELLEFSFVPVPANPFCLTLEKAGFNVQELVTKGFFTPDEKGVIADIIAADNSWATQDAKFAALSPVFDTINALVTAYMFPTCGLADLPPLLTEAIEIMGKMATGTPVDQQEVSDEMKAAMKQAKHFITKESCSALLKAEPDAGEDADEEDQEKTDVLAALAKLRTALDPVITDDSDKEIADKAFADATTEITNILDAEASDEGDENASEEEKALRTKEGRVLSDKNRTLIKSTIDALSDASAALTELHAATDPKGGEGKSADGAVPEQRSVDAEFTMKGLDEFFRNREVLRSATNALTSVLTKLNKVAREKK